MIKVKPNSNEVDDDEIQNDLILEYDVLVLCTGSTYCINEKDINKIYAYKNLHDRKVFYENYKNKIDKAKNVLIVGSGATGVEFLGELISKYGNQKSFGIIYKGKKLLPYFPDSANDIAYSYFLNRGVSMYSGITFNEKKNIVDDYDLVIE